MTTSATTGFCRVTIVAPDSRIDVALPEDIAVADVYPEILRLAGQTQPAGAPTGYHLVRMDGTVLDGNRSLIAQQIHDGELLSLRPFAASLPPAVHDDVSDAIASAVTRDRTLWSDRFLRVGGLIGGALLLVLLGLVLWYADPVRHDMHGLPGIVAGVLGLLLTALAAARARVYEDRASAAALGLAALPHVMIAGSGALPLDDGEGIGRLQFMLGCAAVLLVSIVLVALMPTGDAPFVAAAFASAVGVLAMYGATVKEARPTETAAVCLVVAIGVIGFLPGLSTRVARLPIGYAAPSSTGDTDAPAASRAPGPDEAERIAAQARRGHELLLGLLAGCAAVVVASAIVLGFSGSTWAQVLALTGGLAALLRARLFRYTAQVVCLLVAGVLALGMLILGLALNPPIDQVIDMLQGHGKDMDVRTLWLSAAVAGGGALFTAIGLIVPKKGLTPFWGRVSDLAEGALLLSLVPLCFAVLDLYTSVRSLTS
ncbi:type VII secretion integral membrane protein EccD [Streptomyces palmae]|uniref:Type VII secretion integral membrane protein EccD n=1 Tax=Streptomyces palmae TaxID=1701085 RepID=A0A4Z0HCL0_9ACTN|nr:type VII secretion integral membrane protein EccD [Streptomyces palmae]TGB17581.1 type VII secretion integral membrane protein EccD [Streptomyces palmae]